MEKEKAKTEELFICILLKHRLHIDYDDKNHPMIGTSESLGHILKCATDQELSSHARDFYNFHLQKRGLKVYNNRLCIDGANLYIREICDSEPFLKHYSNKYSALLKRINSSQQMLCNMNGSIKRSYSFPIELITEIFDTYKNTLN